MSEGVDSVPLALTLNQRISDSITGQMTKKSYSELRASETPPIPSSLTDCRTNAPLSDDEERKAYLELYNKK